MSPSVLLPRSLNKSRNRHSYDEAKAHKHRKNALKNPIALEHEDDISLYTSGKRSSRGSFMKRYRGASLEASSHSKYLSPAATAADDDFDRKSNISFTPSMVTHAGGNADNDERARGVECESPPDAPLSSPEEYSKNDATSDTSPSQTSHIVPITHMFENISVASGEGSSTSSPSKSHVHSVSETQSSIVHSYPRLFTQRNSATFTNASSPPQLSSDVSSPSQNEAENLPTAVSTMLNTSTSPSRTSKQQPVQPLSVVQKSDTSPIPTRPIQTGFSLTSILFHSHISAVALLGTTALSVCLALFFVLCVTFHIVFSQSVLHYSGTIYMEMVDLLFLSLWIVGVSFLGCLAGAYEWRLHHRTCMRVLSSLLLVFLCVMPILFIVGIFISYEILNSQTIKPNKAILEDYFGYEIADYYLWILVWISLGFVVALWAPLCFVAIWRMIDVIHQWRTRSLPTTRNRVHLAFDRV